ncbi:MAG: ATP-binding protein [Desulfococcaceae bacterium]
MTGAAYRNLRRDMGRAIHDFEMVRDGDRILVGLSGGADSLSLMALLADRLPRIPIQYSLIAAYVDPGFSPSFAPELERFCRDQGWRLEVISTEDGPYSHGEENRENPCFLCARLRRKRLFEMAKALNCNRIALGHNKDDLIETLFINLCYAGGIRTMAPAQPFFDGRFTVIRPLAYADARTIRRFARRWGFPAFPNPCPSATTSRRDQIGRLLETLYASSSKIKGNIFHAMKAADLLSPAEPKSPRREGGR